MCQTGDDVGDGEDYGLTADVGHLAEIVTSFRHSPLA